MSKTVPTHSQGSSSQSGSAATQVKPADRGEAGNPRQARRTQPRPPAAPPLSARSGVGFPPQRSP